MEFLNIILNSSVFMGLLAFVFTVFGVRCLIYGVLGGTSTILRIMATIVCAAIAYYCWKLAISANGANMIDRFIFDSWHDLVGLIKSINL
ncbi:MAG: hypothetical protein IKN73_03485 [Alphaproteobacteria bacterium]|nr:hypothetical protein [Alphaproteobacteria bacterium]